MYKYFVSIKLSYTRTNLNSGEPDPKYEEIDDYMRSYINGRSRFSQLISTILDTYFEYSDTYRKKDIVYDSEGAIYFILKTYDKLVKRDFLDFLEEYPLEETLFEDYGNGILTFPVRSTVSNKYPEILGLLDFRYETATIERMVWNEFEVSYAILSGNPNITLDIMEANPDKEWDGGYMMDNPNLVWNNETSSFSKKE